MKRVILIMALLLIVSTGMAKGRQDIIEMGYSFFKTVSLDDENIKSVYIYKTNTLQKDEQYFVSPYLVVDTQQNTDNFESVCQLDDQGDLVDASKTVRMRFHYFLSDPGVNASIVSKINADLPKNKQIDSLGIWPVQTGSLHGFYYDDVNPEEQSIQIDQYPTSEERFNNITNNTPLDRVGRNSFFVGECGLIKALLERDKYIATYYSPVTSTSASWVSVALTNFFNSEHFDDFQRLENQTGNIRSISTMESDRSRGGISLSTILKAGKNKFKGRQAVEFNDSRHRYVNAKYIQNVVDAYLSDLDIRVGVGTEDFDYLPVVKQLKDRLVAEAQGTKFTINDKGRLILDNVLDRSISKDGLRALNIDSKYISNDKTKDVIDFKKDGAEGRAEIENGDTITDDRDDRGIEYTFSDDTWVPTSITLYNTSSIQKSEVFDSDFQLYKRFGETYFKQFQSENELGALVTSRTISQIEKLKIEMNNRIADALQTQNDLIRSLEGLQVIRHYTHKTNTARHIPSYSYSMPQNKQDEVCEKAGYKKSVMATQIAQSSSGSWHPPSNPEGMTQTLILTEIYCRGRILDDQE